MTNKDSEGTGPGQTPTTTPPGGGGGGKEGGNTGTPADNSKGGK